MLCILADDGGTRKHHVVLGLALAVEEGRNMNCDNCTENTMKVCAGETATKSLRDMTDTDFDAAHELLTLEFRRGRRPSPGMTC